MKAPIILIGTVDLVRQVAPTRPASNMREVLLDPVEIALSVEHVLKGTVSMQVNRVRILGLLFSKRNARELGQPPFDPRPGQRRIIFARQEGTQLRLFHDVVDYYFLKVNSGDHPLLDSDIRTDPAKAISWLLLTLGPHYDSNRMSEQLPMYVYLAKAISGEDYMTVLLDQLTSVSDSNIRQAAVELKRSFELDKNNGISNSTLSFQQSCP